jgi:hypothetical protein
MNDQTNYLIEQLKDKLIDASEAQIMQIVQEARDEALREAKAMIKERILRAILESAAEEDLPSNNHSKTTTSGGGTWFQPQPSL